MNLFRLSNVLAIGLVLPAIVLSVSVDVCPASSMRKRFLRTVGLDVEGSWLCPLRSSINYRLWENKVDESKMFYSCGSGFWSEKISSDPEFIPRVHIVNASLFFSSSTNNESSAAGTTEDAATFTSNDTAASDNSTVSSKVDGKRSKNDWCMLVNFFSPTCPFSAKLAPSYNALARVYPGLFVAAVDATKNVKLNLVYGISGTPTILLFQNGRPVSRYDQSAYDLDSLITFVSKQTDMQPESNIGITETDTIGPLPSETIEGSDYYLILAVYFVLCCALYHFLTSSYAGTMLDIIKRNWREMNEE